MGWQKTFSQITDKAAFLLGKPSAFLLVLFCTVIWMIMGSVTGWTDTWQLVANTSTNVVTFLMVFLIQNSENRDSAAIQAKLDEILRAVAPRSNLSGIEDLSQEEIEQIKRARQRSMQPRGRT